ncbi:hypothetical protein AB0C12_42635 [Actinoplanes sp. NPDC048967]|uniref:hypothetical protein n=1 Tax=Actinoplanes sp. NPDC048967 TaxID=3155269 RepID=UPI0033CFC639
MTTEISIRFSWLPDDAAGHMLLHRRMPSTPEHGVLDEYWRSGPMGELPAATLKITARSTADWQKLLWGLPMPKVTLPATPYPVELHRLDENGLREVLARTGPVCDVAGASLQFTAVGGVLAPVGGRLDRNPFEPVAPGIAPLLRRTLDDLALTRGAGPPVPAAAEIPTPGQELRAGLESAIQLHDTRGVQIGSHNVQVNRFLVRGPDLAMNFDDVLRNTAVKSAMSALLADPGNSDRRQGLVGALQNVDQRWSVKAQPLTLSAQSRPPGILESLLSFNVQGVQVGDHNTQRNNFHYTVTDSPQVSALLRHDNDLARHLADYLCPATGDAGALATFRQHVGRSVNGLPIDLDRTVDQHLKFPAPGNVLDIFRTDGVTVGNHNIHRSTHEVELTVRSVQVADPTLLAGTAPVTTPLAVRGPKIADRTVAPLPAPPLRGISIGGL